MEMGQTSPYLDEKLFPKRRWKNCNLLFVSMKSKQKTPEKKKAQRKKMADLVICCLWISLKSKQETQLQRREKTGDVSHCGLAIYFEKYIMANEELWKLKYSTVQKYNLQKEKNPLIETKNPSRYYYNSITNLQFQHKPKYYILKILIYK
jgi:hypothetical protein